MNGRATEYVGYMFPPNDDGIIKGAITLEPIVRCRDCAKYVTNDGTEPWCCYMSQPHDFNPDPDGFCAWGERKDG